MVEIYNDKLNDLYYLREEMKKNKRPGEHVNLKISIPTGGIVTITGVNEVEFEDYEQAIEAYTKSIYYRKQASTNFNEYSSRSHLIFSVIIEVEDLRNNEKCSGKLSLVDLAGSENLKNQDNSLRKTEGINVNLSLNALKNVISSLVNKDKHVPYNNNILTKLMKDSLGGDSKTLMIVNVVSIYPVSSSSTTSSASFEQSKNSLLWASKLKEIKNKPKQHRDKSLKEENEAKDKIIQQLVEQIENLEQQLGKWRTTHMNTGTTSMQLELKRNTSRTINMQGEHFNDEDQE